MRIFSPEASWGTRVGATALFLLGVWNFVDDLQAAAFVSGTFREIWEGVIRPLVTLGVFTILARGVAQLNPGAVWIWAVLAGVSVVLFLVTVVATALHGRPGWPWPESWGVGAVAHAVLYCVALLTVASRSTRRILRSA